MSGRIPETLWLKGAVEKLIKLLIGYVIGSLSGVVLMCIFQINHPDEEMEMINDESRDNEDEK